MTNADKKRIRTPFIDDRLLLEVTVLLLVIAFTSSALCSVRPMLEVFVKVMCSMEGGS